MRRPTGDPAADPPDGPAGGRSGTAPERTRIIGWATAALIASALLATMFGGGRPGHATNASDGSAWLWSRATGEVTKVSAETGRADRRRTVPGARGDQVEVTQDDRRLLIHDLDTGRVSSLDLATLGFSGDLKIGTRGDPGLVMGDGVAAVIERTSGQVRALDPASLRPVGPTLRLPGPLTGGGFDGSGTLWVTVPRQGTVAGLRVGPKGPAMERTIEVAEPGHDLVATVLDQGVLVADRSGRDLVLAIGDSTRRVTSPVPLAGAILPERTQGGLAAVTVPAASAVVSVADVRKGGPISSFPLRDPVQEPAVPFAGKVYVPVRETGQVRVFTPAGEQSGVLSMPDGRGDLRLQVREGSLFVNAPGSPHAQVVDSGGRTRKVGKYPDGPGGGGDRPGQVPPGALPPPVPVPPAPGLFPDPPGNPPAGRTPEDAGSSPKPSPSPGETAGTPSARPTSGTPTPGDRPRQPSTRRPSPDKPSPDTPSPDTPPTGRPSTGTPPTRPPSQKPKDPPPPAKNPYTAEQVCNSGSGSGYKVQRSSAFKGGRVYQLYSASSKNNCVVTMKTANVGKGTNVWTRLQSQRGGKTASDSGSFKYYAGPVYLHAPGDCVRYSGGASGASTSAGWANCG